MYARNLDGPTMLIGGRGGALRVQGEIYGQIVTITVSSGTNWSYMTKRSATKLGLMYLNKFFSSTFFFFFNIFYFRCDKLQSSVTIRSSFFVDEPPTDNIEFTTAFVKFIGTLTNIMNVRTKYYGRC